MSPARRLEILERQVGELVGGRRRTHNGLAWDGDAWTVAPDGPMREIAERLAARMKELPRPASDDPRDLTKIIIADETALRLANDLARLQAQARDAKRKRVSE